VGLAVAAYGRAGTEQVAIAVGVVDAAHRRPVLVARRSAGRKYGFGSRVRTSPGFDHQVVNRVRGVAQGRGVDFEAALLDVADFSADGDHGVAEAVELGFGFRLRRFNHERAGHGETHGGRVESVIDEALGDVFHHDAAGFFKRAGINNALVGNAAFGVGKKHGEVRIQARGDIVGGENRDLGRVALAVARGH